MLDLIIFIKHAGANVRQDNLSDTITSLINCCDAEKFGFYFVTEERLMPNVKSHFQGDRQKYLIDCIVENGSWANDFNDFFEKYQDQSEWLLLTHDDIEYTTKGFFGIVLPDQPDKV